MLSLELSIWASVAGAAGRAAKAGTNTSGAGGLYPRDPWGARCCSDGATLDDDPGFRERVEDLAVEQLVPQAGVEALDEAVLPGAARRDVGGLGADSPDPVLHGLGDELRPIVGANMPGTPRRMNRSDSTSITSIDLSLRSMRIARHSWVNSSTMFSMRYFLPSWVRSSTKS